MCFRLCIDSTSYDIDEEDDIIVLSSVLEKPVHENEISEIQRLSSSTLPIIEEIPLDGSASSLSSDEEARTPIVITLDDDDDDEEEIIDVENISESSEQINVEQRSENVEQEDDDIQEVPVDEYTKLAEEEDDSDVQSVTSHVTVIDPFHFSEDDDTENMGSYEPTPRNLRKRRFSEFSSLFAEEEEDDDDESVLMNYEISLRNHGNKRFSRSRLCSDDEEFSGEEIERNGKIKDNNI